MLDFTWGWVMLGRGSPSPWFITPTNPIDTLLMSNVTLVSYGTIILPFNGVRNSIFDTTHHKPEANIICTTRIFVRSGYLNKTMAIAASTHLLWSCWRASGHKGSHPLFPNTVANQRKKWQLRDENLFTKVPILFVSIVVGTLNFVRNCEIVLQIESN